VEPKPGGLLKIIKQVSADSRINSILIPRNDIDMNTGRIANTGHSIRIFKYAKEIRYKGSIHENIKFGLQGPHSCVIPKEELFINHTGYSKEILKSKAQRNLELLLKDLDDGNDEPTVYLHLADCYMVLGKYEEVIQYERLALENGLVTTGSDSLPYMRIIESYIKLDAPADKIRSETEAAMEKFPKHPQLHYYMAISYMKDKDYIRAFRYFIQTLQLQSSYHEIEANNVPGQMYGIYHSIASIYQYQNNIMKSVEYYIKALKEEKYSEEIFRGLMKLLKREKAEDVVELLGQIYDTDSRDDVKFLVSGLTNLKQAKALAYYWNIWYNKYGVEDYTLTIMLLANKRYQEASDRFHTLYTESYLYWTQMFSVVSAILSANGNLDRIKNIVKPSFKRIIYSYQGLREGILIAEDFKDFQTILKELLTLKEREIFFKLLDLKKQFPEDFSEEIGDLLNEETEYEPALVQYQEALTNGSETPNRLYTKMGICFYRMGNFKKSYESFIHAVECGELKGEIKSYLVWIYETCKDETLMSLLLDLFKKNNIGIKDLVRFEEVDG
jgi:tetratricopeptide (TPR) repeat protein